MSRGRGDEILVTGAIERIRGSPPNRILLDERADKRRPSDPPLRDEGSMSDTSGLAVSDQATTFPDNRDRTVAARRDGLVVLPFLVFAGGLASIGTELAASRLLAPYFGTSTLVWANLIGLTLTYLAIGYYAGGRVADRFPNVELLYGLTAVAGLGIMAIPFLARPLLTRSLAAFDALSVGAFYGSFLGVMLLLAIPITLLGFVTPFAIRLRASGIDSAGNTAGRIYALSTVGSIAGSFLPVLLFVPLLGTRMTFYLLGGTLLAVSVAGLVLVRSWRGAAPALLGALAIGLAAGTAGAETLKPPYRGVLVEEIESEYSYIQVLREGDRYLLALNEGHAIHSIHDPDQVLTGGPWDYFLLAPAFVGETAMTSMDRALMIGLAGGTAARSLLEAYPSLVIDGVEIDPEVARIGEEYFALADPRINVFVEDGRYFMHTTDEQYDLIGVDAYRQPYIPFHLTTVEFFQELGDRLHDDGVVVVNAGRTPTDTRLVDALASTMLEVFSHVFLVDAESYDNTMIFATDSPASLAQLDMSIAAAESNGLIGQVGTMAASSGSPRSAFQTMEPFTDDKAPVERVIDQMIVDAAREET